MGYTQQDVDKILEASEKADKGDWRIRKTVDESGDYPFPTYDIIAVYEYGPKGIGSAYQDPYNAIMFFGAPVLAEEVKRLRRELKEYQDGFEVANDGC